MRRGATAVIQMADMQEWDNDNNSHDHVHVTWLKIKLSNSKNIQANNVMWSGTATIIFLLTTIMLPSQEVFEWFLAEAK